MGRRPGRDEDLDINISDDEFGSWDDFDFDGPQVSWQLIAGIFGVLLALLLGSLIVNGGIFN